MPAKITFSNISTLAGLHPYLLLFKIKFKIIENKAEKFLYIEPKCAHLKLSTTLLCTTTVLMHSYKN